MVGLQYLGTQGRIAISVKLERSAYISKPAERYPCNQAYIKFMYQVVRGEG